MPRVKIKQLDERVATNGLHMGGGPERRKLEPGEVVDIAEDFLLPDGQALLELLWSTGKLEMTLDPVTRPLDFANYRQANLCGPRFKPRDPSETLEMERARAVVAARMAETESAAPETDSPANDVPDSQPDPIVVKEPPKTTRNRRAERRAALQAAQRGEALTT
jgi:hypothetical protein